MIKYTRRDLLALAAGTAVVAAMGLPAFAEDAATPAADAAALPEVKDLVFGNADAKVTLTEYASYTCPHCAHFHDEAFVKFKTDYLDTGKVRFIYREVFFDRYGLWAAMMARCGGDMRYLGINGMLFEKQKEWAATDDAKQAIENLKTLGKSAGMTDADLEACFNDQKMAEAMVANFEKNMAADSVEGTPTLFINGTKYSNMSYDDLKKILDQELAK